MKNEFEFIKFLKKGEIKSPRILIGIGDDSAVALPLENKYILLTSDSLCEDIHFRKGWMNPYEIARKALLRGISDVVACGGYPVCANVNLKISGENIEKNLKDFYEGLKEVASKYNFAISGGDLTLYEGKTIVDVFVLGEVEKIYLTLRSGAREGDLVCMTGEIGLSRLAVDILETKIDVQEKVKRKALKKFYNPEIHLKEIREILEITRINSMIDLSDGLSKDLRHIAVESGVKIVIEEEKVPAAKEVFDAGIKEVYEYVINSGEEYELIFTLSEKEYERIKNYRNLKITVIGKVEDGEGVYIKKIDQRLSPLKPGGYDYFEKK